MQTIRATITFPRDLHEELRLEAFRRRRSLSKVLIEKIKPAIKKKPSVEEKIRRSYVLFDKAAKSSVEFDAVKAVREERNRDNA